MGSEVSSTALDAVDSCGGMFFSAPYHKVICMQGVSHMSWHCGCDVIHVNQEESRRYYTILGNTSLPLST